MSVRGAGAVQNALTVAEAMPLILADIAPLGRETVRLADALGRVLAADVVSPVSLPPWRNSSMDGYAVRAADVGRAAPATPVTLPVTETVAAGGVPSAPLAPGTAVRIMTGAPLPDGADTVIRVEDTDGSATRVAIHDARDAGRNVRPSGEDVREGAVAVEAGTVLGAAALGVLASVGAEMVEVHRAPRVGILTTGDELVDVDGFAAVRAGRRIVSSNSYTLRASCALAGAVPVDLGIARDDRADLAAHLQRAAAEHCDLLLTSGGVSVGEFDYTREVLTAMGAVMKMWRVRMRPGAPLGFGLLPGVPSHGSEPPLPWLGLPGNPVSSMVTFELFAKPAIRKLRGERRIFPATLPVVIDEEISIAAPLTHFLRAVVTPGRDGLMHGRLTGPQGSGLLTSMARANALLVVPLEQHARGPLSRGAELRAIPLGDGMMRSDRLVL